MSEIKSFKDLIVWQKGMRMVKMVYELTYKFPVSERYGLITQVRRSAISVPANISEGWGRNSLGSYLQFLKIATGSLYETQTHILIARDINYLNDKEVLEFEILVAELSRMLYKLKLRLESNNKI